MGAQYLSFDLDRAEARELHGALVEADVLREADPAALVQTEERPEGPAWRHCYAPGGTSSVVRHLLAEAEASLKTECYAKRVAAHGSGGNGSWEVESGGGGSCGNRGAVSTEGFDAVLLCTGPARLGADRLDNIAGGWERSLAPRDWAALRSAQYGRRYVVTFFLRPEPCAAACERFFGPMVERLVDDDVIHLVAFQSRKTGSEASGEPLAVVCHTTPEAAQPPRDKCVRAVQRRLLEECLQLRGSPTELVLGTKILTWGKCQVSRSTSSALGGRACLSSAAPAPPLAVCGDYFLGPTASDAVSSAVAGATAVAAALSGRSSAVLAPAKRVAVPAAGNVQRAGGGCQQCGDAGGPTFRDSSDGKEYCRKCWNDFYSQAPPREAAASGDGGRGPPSGKRWRCGECKASGQRLFRDERGGARYCRQCWTAYYGHAPPDAAQGA